MPALLAAPLLIPLLTGVSAAAGLGTTAYELIKGSGSSSSSSSADQQKQQAAALAAQQAAQKKQQQAAVLAQQGNTQASTGGSLTPEAFLTSSAKSAGTPSDLNSIMQFLGGQSGSSNAPVSGGTTTPNSNESSGNNMQQLSDLLKAA